MSCTATDPALIANKFRAFSGLSQCGSSRGAIRKPVNLALLGASSYCRRIGNVLQLLVQMDLRLILIQNQASDLDALPRFAISVFPILKRRVQCASRHIFFRIEALD